MIVQANIGGSGGGGGATTIYNGNSSLTGDRTVDLNNKFLLFHDVAGNSGYFKIDPVLGVMTLRIAPVSMFYAESGYVSMGDETNQQNHTTFTVNDTSQLVTIASGGSTYFSVDAANKLFEFGDVSGSVSGSYIKIQGNSGVTEIGDIGGIQGSTLFTVNDNLAKFIFSLGSVPNYADNAAAITGGLSAGMLYRTSAGGTSTLKIVE